MAAGKQGARSRQRIEKLIDCFIPHFNVDRPIVAND
jgi:hypothetical protein